MSLWALKLLLTNMNKKVIIIGASGHGKVIADIVKKSGDDFVGFLDDDLSKPGVIGTVAECVKYNDCSFIIAIGNNGIRKRITQEYTDLKYYTAIHPTAVVGENVSIGEGTAVMANAVINPSVSIGKHCIINTGAVIEHDNRLESYVHISPKAVLCGTVSIGEGTHVGAAAVVKNNLSVANDVIIGVGAAVVKDIDKAGVYAGVPAKELK